MSIVYKPISAFQTHSLRQRILRPQQPIQEMVYPHDDNPDSFHIGAFLGDRIVGIASIYTESPEGEMGFGDWRLRGMAVEEEMRGRDLGKELVNACLKHVSMKKGARLWCNARTPAMGFYFKLGFEKVGKEFDIEGIGPHYQAQSILEKTQS
ncbi:MAG: GNAT family N-acetyltransferase [Pseudomonadota bacterium]